MAVPASAFVRRCVCTRVTPSFGSNSFPANSIGVGSSCTPLYCVGSSWKLEVSNGETNTSIRLLGTSNGQSWEIRDWRKTDGDGNWSEAGGFAAGTEGRHFLSVDIDGALSNIVSFVVSSCRP